MTGLPQRSLLLATTLLCGAAITGSLSSAARETFSLQEKKEQPTKGQAGRYFVSAQSCSAPACHGGRNERVDNTFVPLCRCTEYDIWKSEDKHSKAFEFLSGPRAKAMAALLPELGDLSKAPQCLSCHAVAFQKADQKDDAFQLAEGVTCVICHGPAKKWINDHYKLVAEDRREWRKKDRKEKQREAGMTDLWDPVERARLCASCHIGDSEAGKVVTHAMYAAGHPPLPSIEFATFSEEMPRHWQYPREKKREVQKLLNFDEEQALWEQSKVVLVSSAVALRESLNLISTQAALCEKAPAGSGTLDYALFDCAACHHELRYPGWRQARGYTGKPGRPQMQVWPTELTRVGLSHIKQKETDFDASLRKLADAFSERPFGNPASIAKEASQLIRWMDGVIDHLKENKFSKESVTSLRQALTSFKKDAYPDYESARQRAWAFIILSDELAWKGQTEGEQKKEYRRRLNDIDKQLAHQLMLQLPSGQNVTIEQKLAESLKRMGNYDPLPFMKAFKQLEKEP